MNIGIRLHDMKPGTLEQRLKEASELGFGCAHLALTKVISEYPVDNEAMTPGLACYLKNLFQKYNIDVAVLGCYLNLATPDAAQLQANQERYYAHLRFASLLGAGVVGTETGAPNTQYSYEPACHSPEALETFTRNLAPVVECAEKFGVIMAIEPVWNHIVWNSKAALQVLKAIQSPNLRIILDPVNLLSIENYKQRDQIIPQAIEDLEAYADVVHIKDIIVDNGKLVSCGAGTGMMNYEAVAHFIRDKKPHIHVTLENTTPENCQQVKIFFEEQVWS